MAQTDTTENIEIIEHDAADVPKHDRQRSKDLDLLVGQYDHSDELIPLKHQSPDAHAHDTADYEHKMSIWKTGFLLVNICLSPVGLLSFPYALAQGSLSSLIANAFICLIMANTGKLIVRAFDAVSLRDQTYSQVGRASMMQLCGIKCGGFGSALVSCAIVFELCAAVCIKIIFIWDNLQYLIGEYFVDFWIIQLVCTFCLFPIIFMHNFSYLQCVSILEWISKVVIIVLIATFFFLDQYPIDIGKEEAYPQSVSSFFTAIGIFVLSFGGHATFPVIKHAMKRPEKFDRVLDVSFLILFMVYSVVGLFGFLRYGLDTNIVITENFVHEDSTGELVVAKLFAALIVVSFYIQTPVVFHVFNEIPETYCKFQNIIHKLMFRTVVFCIVVTISWLLTGYLSVFMAVIGLSFTMLTSIIYPILFYCSLDIKEVRTDLI